MTTTAGPVVRLYVPSDHGHLTPYLAALHASCISHDRTIATFIPPLNQEKLLNYWRRCIAEINAGTRLLLLLLDETEPGTKVKGSELMGCVMLHCPESETGRMRGFVEKLLVSPKFRKHGGARLLMATLESEGLVRGKSLFMVDTETGSPAEEIYKKFGYVEVGKIPNYSISPDGELKNETFFYKQL